MTAVMVDPTGRELFIRRGDDFEKPWGAFEDVDRSDPTDLGGRAIEDLAITSGSTTATSATALFQTQDTDRKIALALPDAGIADGTLMSFVDETTIELSEPATATATNLLAFLRPVNCTAFDTGHLAVIRRRPLVRAVVDAPPPDAVIDVDTTRSAVGVFWFRLPWSVTRHIGNNWFWDWQVMGLDGLRSTWMDGYTVITGDAARD